MREPLDSARVEALLGETTWVRGLARSLVRDKSTAEELVQDLWVAALERWPATGWDLRRWAHGVVRNLMRERQRSEVRRSRRERAAARSESVQPAQELAEQAALHRRLVGAVLDLAEPYRSTVLLRFFQDMPPREIARFQGIPPETVRTRLKRAIDQLRGKLDREHGGRREAWAGLAVALAFPPRAATLAAGVKIAAMAVVAATATWVAVSWIGHVDPSRRDAAVAEGKGSADDVDSGETDVASSSDAARSSLGQPQQATPENSPAAAASPWMAATSTLPVITGVVRSRAGEPIAGAAIAAYMAMVPRQYATLDWDLPVAQTVADDSGRYVLRTTGGWVVVGVDAPGFGRARRLHLGGKRLDFVLGPGGCVAGRVRRAGDLAPVEDATVAVCGPGATINLYSFGLNGASTVYTRRMAHGHVRTDSEGRYRIPDLAPGNYELHVLAPGFPALALSGATMTVRAGQELTREILVRRGGCSLLGRVVDSESGRPVPNARVRSSKNHRRVMRTKADGTFLLEGLEIGPMSLIVETRDHAVHRETIELGSVGTLHCTLPISRLGAVTGRVIDETGSAIEEAVVYVAMEGDQARPFPPQATSDAEGQFELRGIPPGKLLRLQARANGYGSALSPAITMKPGETVEGLIVRVARGKIISGRLTPPPWPPVQISLQSVGMTALAPAPVHTDTTGRFKFKDVAAGRYRFAAWLGRQYHRFETEVLVGRDAVTRVHLSLDPGRTIVGRIVDSGDRPVPWAEISITENTAGGGENHGVVHAGPNGGFRIQGVTRNDVKLSVFTHGRHPESVVVARAGDQNVWVRLSERFSLRGRALSSRAEVPPSSFWVRVHPGGRSWYVQSPDGRFEIPARELPQGVFEVEIGDDAGRISRRVTGLENQKPLAPLELTLRPGGRIGGQLLWKSGEPAADVGVSLKPAGSTKCIQTRTDADGRFIATGLQTGPHRLVVHPAGSREIVMQVGVTAGVRSDVVWRLPRSP